MANRLEITSVEWATAPIGTHRAWQAQRSGVVRRFVEDLHHHETSASELIRRPPGFSNDAWSRRRPLPTRTWRVARAADPTRCQLRFLTCQSTSPRSRRW